MIISFLHFLPQIRVQRRRKATGDHDTVWAVNMTNDHTNASTISNANVFTLVYVNV